VPTMTPGATRSRRARRAVVLITLVTAVLGAVAFVTRDQWTWLTAATSVEREIPSAPTLTISSPDERLFAIDTSRSEARFRVNETLAGIERETVGVSDAIAGDIVINMTDPQRSTIGTVVVNVEVLDTGSTLRDKRIRADFLESSRFRFAEFTPTVIEGLPQTIDQGVSYELVIRGDLTIKDVTSSATFSGSVLMEGDEVRATMKAAVLMSTYGVGPINIGGLVIADNEITLELRLTAIESANAVELAPIEVTAEPIVFDADAPGGFAANVMPVLAQNCARCHATGGPGASTWSLDTAADAAEIAADLVLITSSRYMPPWPASAQSVAFEQDWSLPEHELASIANWVAAGAVLDVDPQTPIVAPADQASGLERDIVTTAREPYVGSTDQPDDYRCLINDPQLNETRWLRAYDFEPDQKEVVHHAVVFLASQGLREQAEQIDSGDEAPGWECFTLTNLQETGTDSVDQVLGWAPGRQPVVYEPGTGLKMEAGDFLVVQIHYNYDDRAPLDLSRMVLDFASQTEVDAAGGSLAPVDNAVYIGPAEIPCRSDEQGPLCARSAALDQAREKYGIVAGFIPDFVLDQCGQQASDYAQMTSGVASSSCDLPVQQEGRIVSIFGHLHELGAAIRLTLNPDTPDETVLLDIPTWSFEWQLGYTPSDNIVIDRNDTLRIECWWDRSLAHNDEPRYILWAEGTGDEMCYSAISTVAVVE